MMNLIRQVASGDTTALEQLYTSYRTIVFRVAFSILHDKFLAEDVMQETFLKVQQKAASFRYGNNEKAWIITIARNTAIDTLKKRQTEFPQETISDTAAPSNDITDNGASERYLQLIQPLSDLDRQIISLHLAGGLKHREIAQILDMNISAVKKRYERAIKKIAKMMEEKP